MPPLDPTALDALFREARTAYRWKPDPVPDETLHALYDLAKLGPTSANSSPARFLFLREGSERRSLLKEALSPGNVEKTMTAPVICIVAHDPKFYDALPRLYPQADAKSWFAGNWSLAESTAMRNGTLQGAYLIMAARAMGLDCGPMSGFDNARVDELFFADTGWKSNFLINLGHREDMPAPPRNPRLDFGEACRIE
jgi:3-hydroxypropanoate dehydrogenase